MNRNRRTYGQPSPTVAAGHSASLSRPINAKFLFNVLREEFLSHVSGKAHSARALVRTCGKYVGFRSKLRELNSRPTYDMDLYHFTRWAREQRIEEVPMTVLLRDGSTLSLCCQTSFKATRMNIAEYARRHEFGCDTVRFDEQPFGMSHQFRMFPPADSVTVQPQASRGAQESSTKDAYMSYAATEQSWVQLRTTDGGTILSKRALESKLLQSMLIDDHLESLAVPFTAAEVKIWDSFEPSEATEHSQRFRHCVTAFKVADFLQHEHSAEQAVTQACAMLQQQVLPKDFLVDSSRRRMYSTPLVSQREYRSKRSYMECCSPLSEEYAAVLTTQSPHIVESLLCRNGMIREALGLWLQVLPQQCYPAAVGAAIDTATSSLTLNSDLDEVYGADCSSYIADLSLALASVASRVTVVSAHKLRHEQWTTQLLSPLSQVQSLEVKGCHVDSVQLPSGLSSLTRLHVTGGTHASNTHSTCKQLDDLQFNTLDWVTQSLRNLNHLKELEYDVQICHNVHSFTQQLGNLTALSYLSLHNCDSHHDGNQALCQSLTSCASLVSLSLSVQRDRSAVSHPLNRLPWMPSLPNLSSLQLRGFDVLSTQLAGVLKQVTNLRVLDMSDSRDYEVRDEQNVVQNSECVCSVIGSLKQLQQLNACLMGGRLASYDPAVGEHDPGLMGLGCPAHQISSRTAALLEAAPRSLTMLDLGTHDIPYVNKPENGRNALQGPALRVLSELTNLKALRLYFCGLQPRSLHRLSALTALETLSVGRCYLCATSTATLLNALPVCMTALDLHDNALSEEVSESLGRLTGLRWLILGPKQRAYGQGYRLFHSCPPDLAWQSIATCLPSLKELRSLRLHFCTEDHLRRLGLTENEVYELGVTAATDRILRETVRMLPNLDSDPEDVFATWWIDKRLPYSVKSPPIAQGAPPGASQVMPDHHPFFQVPA